MWSAKIFATSRTAITAATIAWFFLPLSYATAQKRIIVPQSFRIRVTNEGRPRAGIVINVQQGRPPQLGPSVRSEVTDRSGQVMVEGVSPGDYTVRTGEWDRNDAVIVSVVRGSAKATMVSLNWPNLPMQHTRELRGTIHERGVQLTVFALRSGEQVGSATSDDHGRFAIAKARKGEYILRLQEPGPKTSLQVHGDIGVLVEQTAAADEIDVFLEMKKGFLTYGSFCQLPLNFKVTHLCGQVIDEHGIKLPGIRVAYRDSRGSRHSIITDSSGLFDVRDSAPTETFLEISGPGYIPLRASGIRKGTETTCQRPMRITLPKQETGYGCRSVKGID